MVEEVKERDIINQVRHLYVGDDTGLLKKVKIIAKKIEKEYTTSYGVERTSVKRRRLSDGGEEKVVLKKGPGALTAEDNQTRIRHETDIKFKLLGRYLE